MQSLRLFLIMLGVILLASCAPMEDGEVGESLSPEGLAALSAQLFTEAEEPDTADGFHTRETVYWTEGGSVYHRDRDCYHLRKADAVLEGSVKHARKEGKDRVCSACGGD